MKRLTSILAISVIAVMSAGAARADIASTTYVDNKVSPVSAQANTNAAEIETLKKNKEDVANKVKSGGNMESMLEKADADTKYPTLKAALEIAQVAAGGVTTDLGNLTARVVTAENNITGLGNNISSLQSGKQNKLVSGENGNISGSNGVSVTVGNDGKIAVSGNQSAIDTAIAEAKSAGTAATNALNEYKKTNDAAVNAVKTTAASTAAAVNDTKTGLAATKDIADKNKSDIAAMDTAYKAADIAINNKIGTVATGKTVVEMIADAKTAATYNDTTVKADIKKNADAITTINNGAVMNSGATKAKIDAIAANTTAAANAQSAANAAQATANTAKTTAEAAIAAPDATTTSNDGLYTLTMKVVGNTKTYAWEKIGR